MRSVEGACSRNSNKYPAAAKRRAPAGYGAYREDKKLHLLLFAERPRYRMRDRAGAFVETNSNSMGAIRRRVPVEDAPAWLYELKLDGYRASLQNKGRNRSDFGTRYPTTAKALENVAGVHGRRR